MTLSPGAKQQLVRELRGVLHEYDNRPKGGMITGTPKVTITLDVNVAWRMYEDLTGGKA